MKANDTKNIDAVEACLDASYHVDDNDCSFWKPVISGLREESVEMHEIEERVIRRTEAHLEQPSLWGAKLPIGTTFGRMRYALSGAAAILCIVAGISGYMMSQSGIIGSTEGLEFPILTQSEHGLSQAQSATSVAIRNASVGDTLVITPGIINEPMLISKPLRLVVENT